MRSELGKEYFLNGYNCSTSVVLAFKDLLDLEEDTLVKVAMGFGGGMGHARLTCGAISGAVIVLSLLNASNTTDLASKQALYDKIHPFIKKFEEKFASTNCATLLSEKENTFKALARDEEYYKTRPCTYIVEETCKMLEDYLNEL